MNVAGDYQQYTLDADGLVIEAGERMQAKAAALQAVGLAPDFVNGRSVLDLGTDHGFWAFLASSAGARHVLGLDRGRPVRGRGRVDLVAENNQRARLYPAHDRVKFRELNLGAQWHEFGLFHVAFCMSVYHHAYALCGDHAAVFYWLARHLVPGGLLVWEGPTSDADPVIRKDVPDWFRAGYTGPNIAAAAGRHFEISQMGPALHEPTREIWLLRRRESFAIGYDARMQAGAGGASLAFQRASGLRMDEIEAALGVRPVPGSLNLTIAEHGFDAEIDYYRVPLFDSVDRRNPDADWAVRWCRFYPVAVDGLGGWAMRFEGEQYPDNFVEVIGPHRFRNILTMPAVKLWR